MLGSSLDNGFNPALMKLFFQLIAYFLNNLFPFFSFMTDLLRQIMICFRFQVLQRQIFQIHLNLGNT